MTLSQIDVTTLSLIDVVTAMASRALDAERGMGDGALVLRFPEGILLAVVDGVGHGAEAAEARQSAEEAIHQTAGGDLKGLLASCHERLKATRGASLGLVWLDRRAPAMTWLGVGTIMGVQHRPGRGFRGPAPLMPQASGSAGRRLPPLHPATVPFGIGDSIVLATDGLDHRFIHDLPAVFESEQQIADRLVETHGNRRDDALALVVRCKGVPA